MTMAPLEARGHCWTSQTDIAKLSPPAQFPCIQQPGSVLNENYLYMRSEAGNFIVVDFK